MKRRVRWFKEALNDIVAQIEYISADNPAAARRVAKRLRSAGEKLGEMATGRPGAIAGTYEQVIAGIPYILVYALHRVEGHPTVSILRVVHTAQKWPPES